MSINKEMPAIYGTSAQLSLLNITVVKFLVPCKNPFDEMLNKKSRVQSKRVCALPNTAYAYKQT